MIRKEYPELDIQVDGGIAIDTIGLAASAGANVFVAGNAIFSATDRKERISSLRQIAQNHLYK